MFKKHRSPVQGQKSKLMAFVAYALAGLLASGSAYAVTDQEFQDLSQKVDNNQTANQTALGRAPICLCGGVFGTNPPLPR